MGFIGTFELGCSVKHTIENSSILTKNLMIVSSPHRFSNQLILRERRERMKKKSSFIIWKELIIDINLKYFFFIFIFIFGPLLQNYVCVFLLGPWGMNLMILSFWILNQLLNRKIAQSIYLWRKPIFLSKSWELHEPLLQMRAPKIGLF